MYTYQKKTSNQKEVRKKSDNTRIVQKKVAVFKPKENEKWSEEQKHFDKRATEIDGILMEVYSNMGFALA